MTTETAIAPIHKQLVVQCPVERAFDMFTARIGEWWPLPTHSVDGAASRAVYFEPGDAGRLVEVLSDGRETTWGHILAWDPPHRIVFSWHPGRDCARTQTYEATEVEVRFAPTEDGTQVELIHRYWERLGDRAAAAREEYHQGWDPVLARYVALGQDG
jgi:uncharacterized protein YndB with AHSA1/START domain